MRKLISICVFILFITKLTATQQPNALSFNGSSSYVNCNNSNFMPSTAITFEAWINMSSWVPTSRQTIISNFTGGKGYELYLSSNRLNLTIYRAGAAKTISYLVNTFSANSWHHIAFSYNGQYMRLYTDGTERVNDNAGSANNSISYTNGATTYIGCNYGAGAGAGYLNGKIDEFRIWNIAKTPTNRTAEVDPTDNNLLIYFRNNQGIADGNNTTVTNLVDISNSSNNTYALVGFSLTAGSTSNWTLGMPLTPFDQASNVEFSNITSNSATVTWVRPGDDKGGNNAYAFIAPAAADPLTLNDGTTYATETTVGDWTCIYVGTLTSVNLTGLFPQTDYKVQVFEAQEVSGQTTRYKSTEETLNPSSFTTALGVPTVQAEGVSFSSITPSSFHVSWSIGDGSSRVVFATQGNSGSPVLSDNTTYTANSEFAGTGSSNLSGWYCVYNGTSNEVTVTGLTSGNTYRIMVIEYNGTSGNELYLNSTALDNPNNVSLIFSTTWNGSAWSHGAPTNTLDATLTGNYSVAQDINCKDFTIQTGVNLNIQPGNSVTVYGNLVNNGIITCKSPADRGAAGSFICNSVPSGTGTMRTERYLSPGDTASNNTHWHFMSSPVASILAETVFTFCYGLNYNENTSSWVSLGQHGTNLVPGRGYMIKTLAAKTVVFSGSFNNGDVTANLTHTGDGYNLVGNPYPSAIDWNSGITKTGLDNSIWIWNPNNQNYMIFDGQFGTAGGSRYIQSMQGFFVHVSAGSGQLVFTNTTKTHSNENFQKSANIVPEFIRFEIKGTNNFTDELVLYFKEGNNDAYKFFSMNSKVPQIYTSLDSIKYGILKINPNDFIDKLVFPISVYCADSGTYSIKIKELTFNNNIELKLADKIKKDTIDLINGSAFNFNYNTKDLSNRFDLIMTKKGAVSVAKANGSKINIWSDKQKVFVNLPFSGSSKLEIFNLEGKNIISKTIYSPGLNTIQMNNNEGIFIVRVINKEKVFTGKVYIK